MYLMGYQFVQPHFASLIIAPISGLYENQNIALESGYNLFYSPSQSTSENLLESFLLQNSSQMNTGINNTRRSAIANGLTNIFNPIGLLGSAIGGFTSVANARASYEAIKEDLSRQSDNETIPVSESTYKLSNGFNAYFKQIEPNEIDKEKLWSYHSYNGYYINKNITINPSDGDGIDTLANRLFYNY